MTQSTELENLQKKQSKQVNTDEIHDATQALESIQVSRQVF